MSGRDDEDLWAAARSILASPSRFFSTPEAVATLDLLERRLGLRTLRRSRSRDHSFDSPRDAATEILVELIGRPDLCCSLLASATPFELLWSDVRKLVGRFTDRRVVDGRTMYSTTIENPKLMLPEWTAQDPADLFSQTVLGAIRSTALTVAQKTPPARRPLVPPVVAWLSINPVQRHSYAADELDAAAERYPELTRPEISAIANITWGSRNRENDTSVLRWYLRTPDVSVKTSPSHLAALLQFQQKMNSSATPRHRVAPN